MSLADALLGLADDLNTHLGAQHDMVKLRQQHADKLVQHNQQRQHKQAQQQQQRKRHREEQQQEQQLQYNTASAPQRPTASVGPVERRGEWSSGETSQLHSLLHSTRRRQQGYSTDSDDDSSDDEQLPPAHYGGAELQFDDYCAIARRLRRPVQEVMTFSAPVSSPLVAFLRRSTVSEAAAPAGAAQYAEFIAQQFHRSLGLEADIPFGADGRQQHDHEHSSIEYTQEKREAEKVEEEEAQAESEEEEEQDESEQDGQLDDVNVGKKRGQDDESGVQTVRSVHRPAAQHDDDSDSSDKSYRADDDEYEEQDEEAPDESDDSSDGDEEDEESSEEEDSGSLSGASVESDVPLSARVKHRAKQSRHS